jgi:methyl-accepting chemotaxis protein
MMSDIGDGKKEKALDDRFSKVTTANDVIDYGNAVRIAVWKSQTLRDPKVIKDALPNFDRIAEKMDFLIKNSVDPANIEQLKKVKEGGEEYKASMLELLANWEKLQLLAADQDKAGQAVLDAAKNTTIQGIEDADRVADLASTVVTQSLWVLIIGLSMAVLVL